MLTPVGSYVEPKAQQVSAATRHWVANGFPGKQTRGQGREGGGIGGVVQHYYYYYTTQRITTQYIVFDYIVCVVLRCVVLPGSSARGRCGFAFSSGPSLPSPKRPVRLLADPGPCLRVRTPASASP